jgi:Holliday junction resolvase RusA-like endonuclease
VIQFTIRGEPKAKQRPRFVKQSGRTYTPKQTVDYENWVKLSFMESKQEKLEGKLTAELYCYYKIPKSTSKKKREAMILGVIRPIKKPDLDNIAKIVLDSLNNLAYDDDKQIVDLRVYKFYGDTPCVEVKITET